MAKNKTINVEGTDIVLFENNQVDFISLTDMARYRDAERSDYILQNWMRNRSTLEFIGLWEQFNTPDFNSIEFDRIKNMSGSNSFSLTPKRWIETTNAVGIVSKTGRYGGTFTHKDIAFEFASWLSAEFKFYLIKEFQRLKEEENDRLKLEIYPVKLLTRFETILKVFEPLGAKVNFNMELDNRKKLAKPITKWTPNKTNAWPY